MKRIWKKLIAFSATAVMCIGAGVLSACADGEATEGPQGPKGNDGNTPYIGADGYWYIGDVKTDTKAQGEAGSAPTIEIKDGYWYINDENTNVQAEGTVSAPTVEIKDGYWYINGENTNVQAEGTVSAPTVEIDSEGYWVIDGERSEKAVPEFSVDKETGNWIINGTLTNCNATGADGITPHIGKNGNWFFGVNDSGIKATGQDGADGVCSIVSVDYVTGADKWDIAHQLQITYTTEDGTEEKVLTDQTVNIVDQGIYYSADSSDDIWELLSYNVRRIRITQDIIWSGNSYTAYYNASGQANSVYLPLIELSQDVEFGLSGHTLTLDADAITIINNSAVSFKNGSIRRVERVSAPISSRPADSYVVMQKTGLDTDGDGVEDITFSPDTSAYTSTSSGSRIIDANGIISSTGATQSSIFITDFGSLSFDTIDYVSTYCGVYVNGRSAVFKATNNTVMEVNGAYVVSTNASDYDNYDVVVDIKDSTLTNLGYDLLGNASGNMGTAILFNVPGSLIVENCSIYGRSHALFLRGGKATLRNSTLENGTIYPMTASSAEELLELFTATLPNWGIGNTAPFATVVVGNRTASAYSYASDCTLANCAVKTNSALSYAVLVSGNTGTEGNGYGALAHKTDGVEVTPANPNEWVGATFTYDAMTFSRSGGVDFHIEIDTLPLKKGGSNKPAGVSLVYRPEMLLKANEWYEADTQLKIRDLLDYGAKNIRLTANLELEKNSTAEGEDVILLERDLDIDLNGFVLTLGAKLLVKNNASLALRNGTVVSNVAEKPAISELTNRISVDGNYAIEVSDFCELTLRAVNLYAVRSGIYMNGRGATLNVEADSEIRVGGFFGIGTNVDGTTDFGVIITIKYSKIYAGANQGSYALPDGFDWNENALQNSSDKLYPNDPDSVEMGLYGVGVLLNVPGTLKVEKASEICGYTQGIIIRDGIAVIENSTVKVVGSNENLSKYVSTAVAVGEDLTHEAWERGYRVPSAVIVIGTYQTQSKDGNSYLYQSEVNVTLVNVTLVKSDIASEAGASYVYMHNDNTADVSRITYDELTAWKSLVNEEEGTNLVTTCPNNDSNLEIWDGRTGLLNLG